MGRRSSQAERGHDDVAMSHSAPRQVVIRDDRQDGPPRRRDLLSNSSTQSCLVAAERQVSTTQ